MPDYDEKTEAPTGKRRSEAREQGNIAKSPDLSSAVILAGALVLFGIIGESFMTGMQMMTESMLEGGVYGDDGKPESVGNMLAVGAHIVLRLTAPFAIGIFALGLIANVLQVGFLVTLKPLQPSPNKLNPIKGLQQIFSWKGTMRFLMSMGKTALVLAVSGLWIYLHYEQVLGLLNLPSASAFVVASEMVYILAWIVVAILLVLAIADYAFQKWQHERDLKMTKQEVKDEMRQMEGDPKVKQRRAQVARQLAMQRIAQAVPQADVVITNPTHFAVALKYDEAKMSAPTVVAKGADMMALKIRRIAEDNEIVVLERKDLARALYAEVEIGETISPQHYQAVAEVLSYVYKLNEDYQKRSA